MLEVVYDQHGEKFELRPQLCAKLVAEHGWTRVAPHEIEEPVTSPDDVTG